MHIKNFKSGKKHDVTTLTFTDIFHVNVIGDRSPAHLPSLVQKDNTFQVMRNNVKYPRTDETFGGWFGPYVILSQESGLFNAWWRGGTLV